MSWLSDPDAWSALAALLALEVVLGVDNVIFISFLASKLPADQQDAVLNPGPRRRVILATNVAETSVTVPGVTGVIDTGQARILAFDPAVGLDRLELAAISQASAEQRAGRAGRLQPGHCVRLWSGSQHGSRPAHNEPEVRRVDLAGATLAR